jgi:hypothetical protein
MKKSILIGTALALALGAVVYAQAPGEFSQGWGPGMGWGNGMGWGYGMGPAMMRGGPGPYGQAPCGAWGGGSQAQVTEENAKAAVQQYAEKYFKSYKVERILPFVAMSGLTMYQAELSGPNGENRILHVNPWGQVMPFGGAWARTR